ncbi:hypothetical protein [Agreia sp. VKM Ac-1783]|uniref:hypothetical protein n=1 Tax=Agreia sp. VKM Ac-1783 TaxID=1938889 RepID=UPI000A2AAE1A|nr:hypothetical protein [Agreia sp. VKM Ac-1783]SMQ62230.1 hypothetical protein SAMN06295943_0735 [Agreia sp. VKM Ac-1783]
MSGFFGADVAELRSLARTVEGGSEQLAAIRALLSQSIGQSAWDGPDGADFTAAWHSRLAPGLQRASERLATATETLKRNADEQDQASQDGSGSSSSSNATPASFGTGSGSGDSPTTTSDGQYTIGPPSRPDIAWDEDFEYDSKDPGPGDYASAAAWKARLAGAGVLRPDLDDAMDAYGHYWDNNGDPFEFDYEEAVREDSHVADNVDGEITRAQAAAEELIKSGQSIFEFTGAPTASSAYPTTENWTKTIGAYQQWSSADVAVDGDKVTMTVTVHAEDRYNFNAGQSDIASGQPDDANGRFTELGWAKPFDSSGSVTRTVTWTVGDPTSGQISEPEKPSER